MSAERKAKPVTQRMQVRTNRARAKFLTHLRDVPNVSAAARAAGISRNTAYAWKADDPSFHADWEEALAEAIDTLEQVAWERAGEQSDRLMEILLKAHRPEKYVERQILEHSGKMVTQIELVALEGPDSTSA